MGPDALKEELAALLNRHSRENASNTPDFILAEFMLTCLAAFEHTTNARGQWWGPREAEARRELLSDGLRPDAIKVLRELRPGEVLVVPAKETA